jgi:hypothetical protein
MIDDNKHLSDVSFAWTPQVFYSSRKGKVGETLFQIDINRREQGCAAHYEQYCQHVVTALFNCNNLEQHG